MSDIRFHGRILPGGALLPDDPGLYGAHLRRLAGRAVEIIVRPVRPRRSGQQNRWYWGVAIPAMADHLGYDRHEYDQLHYALIAKCFGTHRDARTGLDLANVRSSQLTTKEFSEFMEWLARWSAQDLGFVLPMPGEGQRGRTDIV